MNLTVARYFTPSGRSIQKSYAKGINSYFQDTYQSQREEDLYIDSIKKNHISLHTFKTAKGRSIFDASGITPDYIVPTDTSYLTAFYKKINEKNLLLEFTYRFLIQQNLLKQYKNAINFYRMYKISSQDSIQMLAFFKTQGVVANTTEIKQTFPKLKHEAKSLLARYYFKEEGFYQLLNSEDEMINKALEVLAENK